MLPRKRRNHNGFRHLLKLFCHQEPGGNSGNRCGAVHCGVASRAEDILVGLVAVSAVDFSAGLSSRRLLGGVLAATSATAVPMARPQRAPSQHPAGPGPGRASRLDDLGHGLDVHRRHSGKQQQQEADSDSPWVW